MCTVMTVDSESLLGRTMDFPPRTPWHLTYLPAGYSWQAHHMPAVNVNRHALLGGMRVIEGHYLVGDAVNDAGLAGAELFFPVAADYPQEVRPNTQGLTPQDFIMWAVGTHATVKEVAADLANVTVVDARWYDQQRYPFHWILMDKTGTYVIEPLAGRLRVRKNPLAVFTNTPALDEHLKRLAAYLGYSKVPGIEQLKTAIAMTNEPMPTEGNAVQRFIRAALWRWRRSPQSATELLEFLRWVTVPHTSAHAHNYTHYQAVIDIANQQYDFHDLHSGEVVSKSLRRLVHDQPTKIQRFC